MRINIQKRRKIANSFLKTREKVRVNNIMKTKKRVRKGISPSSNKNERKKMELKKLEDKINRIEDVVNLHIGMIKTLYQGKRMVSKNIETNILFRIATSLMEEINKSIEEVKEERKGKIASEDKKKEIEGLYQ